MVFDFITVSVIFFETDKNEFLEKKMEKSWTLLLTSRHEFMDFIIAEILSLCEQESDFQIPHIQVYSAHTHKGGMWSENGV